MMKQLGLLIGAVALAACASPGVPPGGPVDTEAPQIVRIVPDSGKAGITPREVIFRFDEVVSERPSGAQSLSALFLISPRDGEPKVDWHREEISVRPRRGWKKNTAYTISLLPGLSDLRGNARNTGAVTMFATGETIPVSRIAGTVFNWPETRVITRGLVEARPRSDTSLAYIATTDSLGGFVLPNIPPGQYILRGFSDENSNRGLDPREAWDTAAVSLTDTAVVDIYAFSHDSVGARIQNIAVVDSATIAVTFDNALALSPPVTPANVRVRAADSAEVQVLSVSGPPADTTAVARRLKRPIPPRTLTVKLARPLVANATYRVSVTDIHNLSGIVRSTNSLLKAPAAFPAPQRATPATPPRTPPPAPAVRR